MAKLRRDTADSQHPTPTSKPLRIVASGTLFVTHTLSIPTLPAPSTAIRAHSVEKSRGGSANTVLSLLAQFPAVESVLVAPLGGNEEGRMIIRDLEREGILTHYCKVYNQAGVPSAWVLQSSEEDTRTVINHNPLPDITHEDFVSLLGPLLAPENYPPPPCSISPTTLTHAAPPSASSSPLSSSAGASPRPSQSSARPAPALHNPNSPAPFDWLHFEGRSVKTTLSNMTGLDGLARERKWRSHCVFSLDVARKGRQGVEALIPHADVIFLNRHYAQTSSPHYASTPRAFLLSLTTTAPAHALLVAHWGTEGAAVLSLPTREYFQSSGWVEERHVTDPTSSAAGARTDARAHTQEVRSVRSGSDFWAGGRSRTPSSTGLESHYDKSTDRGMGHEYSGRTHVYNDSRDTTTTTMTTDEDDNDSQGTERPSMDGGGEDVVDEVGAQEAFVAGMIYALSRRVMPGSPYTPSWNGEELSGGAGESDRGRWRLDECLRFATELSGRKARRKNWDGLAEEMVRAGWFE